MLRALVFALPLALAAPVLEQRQGATRNDLLNGECAPVTVIFARGTIELGNVGAIVGPPFFDALDSTIGDNAVQGVAYPADILGFLEGGDPVGSSTMAQLVTRAASQCPDTAIVMSGYSQGAQLVHNAAAKLTASVAARVSSVVMFGDPDDGEDLANGLQSKSLTICHDGDDICAHGDLVLIPHLTYAENVQQAADFVQSML